MSALLPVIFEMEGRKSLSKDEFLKASIYYILPIVLIALFFFIFKVYVSKLYQVGDGTYGLSPISLKSFMQATYYFFVLVCEVPLLLIDTLPLLFRWQVLIIAVLMIGFFILLRKSAGANQRTKLKVSEKPRERLFVGLVVISLISCATIFLLSGYPAETFGHYNKMMVPSLILLSIFLAWGVKKVLTSVWMVLALLLFILWPSSMVIQLDNFVESWRTRKEVLSDCVLQLNKTDLGENPYLIACVPFFTQDNYNNEHVFWLSWDFKSGLEMFGARPVSAFPISWRSLGDDDRVVIGDKYINYRFSKFPVNGNIWYYEFDQDKNRSRLERIIDKQNLEAQFQRIREYRINYHPIILRERIRMGLKKKVMKAGFL
ncbi:MAG: hypothetical protein V3U24_11500 [Candidatus Neomarinimicrobiota bacterium]